MKFKKCVFLIFLFYSYAPILAQVDTAWVRRYNSPTNGEDGGFGIAVDGNLNVYVTGEPVTIKYLSNGDTAWVRDFDIIGSAITVDDSGNVYVAGTTEDTLGFINDYTTIKFAPNGDTLWMRFFPGSGGSGGASAIAVDETSNVFVTGFSYDIGTSWNYTTIKYAPNGDTLWVRHYNGPQNFDDEASDLAVDDSGNVYVTGVSFDSGFFDFPAHYVTLKYSPSGNLLWFRVDDAAVGPFTPEPTLALDGTANLYVAGATASEDFLIIKYDSNGDTVWVRTYDGGSYDEVNALALADSGNLYVTGTSFGAQADYLTIKYATNGDLLWDRRYDGPANGDDVPSDLEVDRSGKVYVTGKSELFENTDEYTTLAYDPDGAILWEKRFSDPPYYNAFAWAMVVDDSGNVYVTGDSYGGDTSQDDYVTIKYIQLPCLAKPGDANADGNVLLPDIITIINFLFKSAPAPTPLCRGDANGNGTVLLPDIIYLINFLFKSGPAPVKSKECCL